MKHLNRRNTMKLLGLVGGATAVMAAMVPSFAADTKINVGALRFTSHAASFVAMERGYFKDEGLDVSFKFFQARADRWPSPWPSRDVDYAVTAIFRWTDFAGRKRSHKGDRRSVAGRGRY